MGGTLLDLLPEGLRRGFDVAMGSPSSACCSDLDPQQLLLATFFLSLLLVLLHTKQNTTDSAHNAPPSEAKNKESERNFSGEAEREAASMLLAPAPWGAGAKEAVAVTVELLLRMVAVDGTVAPVVMLTEPVEAGPGGAEGGEEADPVEEGMREAPVAMVESEGWFAGVPEAVPLDERLSLTELEGLAEGLAKAGAEGLEAGEG